MCAANGDAIWRMNLFSFAVIPLLSHQAVITSPGPDQTLLNSTQLASGAVVTPHSAGQMS